jgi:hypothetical protein
MSAYKEDINCNLFRDEVRQFLIFAKQDNAKCPSEMYKLILCGLLSTFPNVETILKIYLTIPISNASGELSFSVLKRVKNYLRNSMGQIRLENLAILCIESTDTENFDYTKVIDIFAKAKSRKKIL